tara:strand:+ start:2591 stop:3547 length:957 start_codon:yes stop_codon:yes gene_type:complete
MPPNKKTRKAFSTENCSPGLKPYQRKLYTDLKNGVRLNNLPSDSGLMHTVPPACPSIEFGRADNEKVIRGAHDQDSWIVFGTDRPSTVQSGYGSFAQRANSIDMVVGRMSAARKGKGPKDGAIVGPSFETDAARIYISQLSKIDKDFGLAEGRIGKKEDRSAIAIKADGVRIIGREGVKIVTGRMRGKNELNSLGGKILPAPGIELIAGNDGHKKHLQAIPKGRDLILCLQRILKMMRQIVASVNNFYMVQSWINKVIGWTGMLKKARAPMVSVLQGLARIYFKSPHDNIRTNLKLCEQNYLKDSGKRFILSRNVRCT